MTELEFVAMIRQALLMIVDAIERKWGAWHPRTAELRKDSKRQPERS